MREVLKRLPKFDMKKGAELTAPWTGCQL